MGYKTGVIVYRNGDGEQVVVNGETVCDDHEPENRAPAIHLGAFPNGRPRRISGLARYPGDPGAVCRSMDEVNWKCQQQGKKVARVDDLYYAEPRRKGT